MRIPAIFLVTLIGISSCALFAHDHKLSDFSAPTSEVEQISEPVLDDTVIFEQLSIDRIETLRHLYAQRLFKIKTTVLGVLASAGVIGTLGLVKNWDSFHGEPGRPAAAGGAAPDATTELERIRLAIQAQDQKFTQKLKQPIAWAIGVGIGAAIVGGIAPLAKVLHETSTEAVRLWWHGFEYWFKQINERMAADIGRLCASLGVRLQEAEAALLPDDAEQFPLARAAQLMQQQNRVRDLQERQRGDIERYYRATVITEFQCVLGTLERLIALMFEIAPAEKHTAIARGVERLALRIKGLTNSLERDLNTDTQMIATYYSATTRQCAHKLYEEIKIFINQFNVYWRI